MYYFKNNTVSAREESQNKLRVLDKQKKFQNV